ncbi:MAG TPA: bifunctional glycosyltransferase family 2/GtrA family protein [Gaiellales bacterium]|jgi:putative flippase GtrA
MAIQTAPVKLARRISTRAGVAGPATPPAVDIVVPVYNEIAALEPNVRRLHAYLSEAFPFTFRITIADNGSTDGTWDAAVALERELGEVRAVRLEQKGRGRALHAVWSESDAQVLAYMDSDLSTDLAALLPLVAPLLSGHSDLAIGTRLSRGSRVVRGPKREVISRCYNAILHVVLRARFSDAQCGFKAIRADCARELLPLVHDRAWFFDTELLVLAERAGLRIHEVPVDWVDDPDSRVDIVSTALADLRGVARLAREMRATRSALAGVTTREGVPGFGGQVLRFAAIGAVSTLAYTLLFIALRSVVAAQAANAVALLATAVGNTAANRRLTFAIRDAGSRMRHQAQGLVVFGLALAVTSLSLVALHALSSAPSRAVELAVLVAANLVATILRFVLFRSWVFRARRAAPETHAPEAHWSTP